MFYGNVVTTMCCQSPDVVRAYKGLLKEKEALEASLSALAETSSTKASSDGSVQSPEGQIPESEGHGDASPVTKSQVLS